MLESHHETDHEMSFGVQIRPSALGQTSELPTDQCRDVRST